MINIIHNYYFPFLAASIFAITIERQSKISLSSKVHRKLNRGTIQDAVKYKNVLRIYLDRNCVIIWIHLTPSSSNDIQDSAPPWPPQRCPCKLQLLNCPTVTTSLRSSGDRTRGTGWQLGAQETPDVLDKLHSSAPIPPSNVNAPVDLSHLQMPINRSHIRISAARSPFT